LPLLFPFVVFFLVVGITNGCLDLVENATVEQERTVMSVCDDLISNKISYTIIEYFFYINFMHKYITFSCIL